MPEFDPVIGVARGAVNVSFMNSRHNKTAGGMVPPADRPEEKDDTTSSPPVVDRGDPDYKSQDHHQDVAGAGPSPFAGWASSGLRTAQGLK
jgi:hypothetical protein